LTLFPAKSGSDWCKKITWKRGYAGHITLSFVKRGY
jgi:hypothetical protein